jgi:hypothetical protein
MRLRKLKMSGANSRPPDVETVPRRVPAAASRTDHESTTTIVKFGMSIVGYVRLPFRRPLLHVVQALLQERPRDAA